MSTLQQLVKTIGPTKLSIMAAVAAILIIGFVVISMRLTTTSYSTLYANLDTKDSSYIITELSRLSIPYEIKNNGSEVLVPAEKVLETRMMLAKNGLPSGGSIVGYEIFDQSDALGTSNFVYNVNLIRALEGELGRTIGSFEKVETARVHLVIPKRELFASQQKDPTASVVLKLRSTGELTKEEVFAISHLVATAVPGLKVSNITIVDTKGRPFKLGGEEESDTVLALSNNQEYRTAFEQKMKRSIQELVERYVGAGSSEVHVTAAIDFDRIVTNAEIYDPDGKVVRSVQTVEEKEQGSQKEGGGNVSVSSNLPNESSSGASGENKTSTERTDETVNYEITKTIKNHIKETGTIKLLSIAIMVDGTYTKNEKTDQMDYAPRKPEELKQIESLVKSAIGFDEKRGDKIQVLNMKFSRDAAELEPESNLDWIKTEFHNILQTLVIAIVVILVILLVIRPMVGRAFELSRTEEEAEEIKEAVENVPTAADIHIDDGGREAMGLEQIEQRAKIASMKNINDIVKKYPQEALSVIRGWVSKEDAA